MTEQEWLVSEDPKPMLEFLRGKASDRKLRLFVVACCRRIWEGLVDLRSRHAVETAERFADDNATTEEMLAACDTAYVAVDDCVNFSPFSEDQAIAAYLVASANVDEAVARYDPFPGNAALHAIGYAIDGLVSDCNKRQAVLLRDIFGNPFHPVALDPSWLTSTVVALAKGMYESRDFGAMPILADALQDAGCDNDDVLNHCRGPGPHVRGCWVVDLVLGKT